MKKENTEIGFTKITFTDGYNEKCSLQKSSSVMEDRIWLGIDNPKLTIFEDENMGRYIVTKMPKHFMVSSRMHLSRKQVKELLPYLQKFVDSGGLE